MSGSQYVSCSDTYTPCVLQLRVKIQKQMAIREQKARRKNLTKYIPNAAAAIFTVQSRLPPCCCTSRTRHQCRFLRRVHVNAGPEDCALRCSASSVGRAQTCNCASGAGDDDRVSGARRQAAAAGSGARRAAAVRAAGGGPPDLSHPRDSDRGNAKVAQGCCYWCIHAEGVVLCCDAQVHEDTLADALAEYVERIDADMVGTTQRNNAVLPIIHCKPSVHGRSSLDSAATPPSAGMLLRNHMCRRHVCAQSAMLQLQQRFMS
jgi:hypothetical protein